MENLRLNDRGFSILESLVAFVLISFLLMLYLPSFYPELVRLNQAKLRTAQWQLLHELVLIRSEADASQIVQQKLSEQRMVQYTKEYKQEVVSFYYDALRCSISFEDGSELNVAIVEE